jgi:uncharacterized protein with PQ loop repeat
MVRIWSKVTMVMGVLMGLFPLLHIHEMYKYQSSIGQSFVGVIFWEVGIATWLIYGILKKDRVIVIANSIAVSVGLLYLMAIKYYAS